ncbi:MAG: peptide-methionine (S)-S-oxide reductase MsrA [Vampirovibrionales bacterium]|nr:peptide-methionine (S)-S-oxide reductase MsrA [Vampirovibrionales bacterium]
MTTIETAIVAAGCFWGVEAFFAQVPGVVSTQVGYIGGSVDHPTYEQVCTGTTGHAEGVAVVFDSVVVSYSELLSLFWRLHDPTTLNRQGPDIGTQYRSAIFTTTPDQATLAATSKQLAQVGFSKPIVTEIAVAPTFWPAEDYHQQYFAKRGMAPSCHTLA